MEIEHINAYSDSRFSQTALNQHGCFLVDGIPYEIEIMSDFEAIVRGTEENIFEQLIEEFRYYAPHVTKYYNERRMVVKEYASSKGWQNVRAVISEPEDWVDIFVNESKTRNVYKPSDLTLLKHEEYEEK